MPQESYFKDNFGRGLLNGGGTDPIIFFTKKTQFVYNLYTITL